MIRYTKEFKANVQGELIAKFDTDSSGRPVANVEDGTTFYFITFSLHTQKSDDIRKVTYLLDSATFWEPERVSQAKQQEFQERITSYGDFLVRVVVALPTGDVMQQALLSDMLEAGHPQTRDAAVQSAIDAIRAN